MESETKKGSCWHLTLLFFLSLTCHLFCIFFFLSLGEVGGSFLSHYNLFDFVDSVL